MGRQKNFAISIFLGGRKIFFTISDFLTKNRKKNHTGGIKIFLGNIPEFLKKNEQKSGSIPDLLQK